MAIRSIAVTAVFASAALSSGLAQAQAYPSKPIKITTASAGAGLDVVIRMVGNGITGTLGQPIVVENRPTTAHPEDAIAKGTPDGYSLCFLANAVWLAPYFRADLPYDPLKDFSPVTLAGMTPNVLAVNASFPAKSVADLVAMAKAKPEALNAFVSSPGGSLSMPVMLLEYSANVKFTKIIYKGTNLGLNDLLANRIQLMFPTIASGLPLIKAGKLRGLAVTSASRSQEAPDLPTMSSLGFKDVESVSAQALLAPPKTPPAIVNRLNQEVVKFLLQSDVKAKIAALGIEVVGSSPADLAKFMKSEIDRVGPVVKAFGIKPGDNDE